MPSRGLNSVYSARRLFRVWLLILAGAVGLAACTGAPARPARTPTASPPALATPLAPATLPARAGPSDAGPLVLNWWAPDFITTAASAPGGTLLEEQLRDFTAQQAGNIRVNLVTKAKHGKGGLLDLLRTAQPVAPAVLPDLIALDISELSDAAAAGLLQPLDDVIDPALIANLYPFARQTASYGGRFSAVPFIADVEHLAYDRARVRTAPLRWSDLSASVPITYLFPLANPQLPGLTSAGNLSQAFVSQYLSAGGALNPDTHQLVLDETPLHRVLAFYAQARDAGILPAGAGDVATLDDCWNAYTEARVTLTNVSARHYLTVRDSLKNSGYAALPGWDGPATPVASGWAFAILTNDPTRKAAAAQLITWLLAPQRLGAWTQAAGWLPALPTGWTGWGANAYYEFLQGQLSQAVAGPVGLGDLQMAQQLHGAIASVLAGDADPGEAVSSLATPAPGK